MFFPPGSIYHYYESRRRLLLDSRPERLDKKGENVQKTKKTQRQRTVSYIVFYHSFISMTLVILSMWESYQGWQRETLLESN